jgi:hypothetical protein
MSAMTTKAAGAAIGRHAAALAAFAALAVFLTWPLASRLATHLPGGGYGDNVTSVWNFWWMRHALSSRADDVFFTSYLFYPAGVDLTLHTHTALAAFAGATALGRLSIVSAQNVAILLTVALNGFCAYLLAWRITRDRAGALLAGIFFAAAPYFAGRLLGHLNLLGAWCLPLFWLLMARALDARSWRFTIAAGAIWGAAVYTDYYYTVYIALLLACLVGARWLRVAVGLGPARRRATAIDAALIAIVLGMAGAAIVIALKGGTAFSVFGQRVSLTTGFNLRTAAWIAGLVWLWRRFRPCVRIARVSSATPATDARLTAIAGLVVLACALPLVANAWQMWQRGDYVSHRYLWRSAPQGIDVATMVAGPPFHPLWGNVVEPVYAIGQIDRIESVAWFGLAPIVFLWLTRRAWLRWPGGGGIVTVAIAFFVWALGPNLVVLGWNTGLYLPQILMRYLPIVSNARVPGRAIVMVYLAAALWLAIGIASQPARRRTRLAALIALATLVDFAAAPLPVAPLDPPRLYRQLAAMPAGAVIELPLGVRDGFGEEGTLDHRTLYYQSIHGRPMTGGFVARLPPSVRAQYDASAFLKTLLDLSAPAPAELPEAAIAESLSTGAAFCRQHGIRYVVLNTRLAGAGLQAYVASLPWLTLELADAERRLYVIQ